MKPTPHDGRRALIIGNEHPWKGEIATCVGIDNYGGKWALTFKSQYTTRFAVFTASEIKWIDPKRK